LVQRLLADRDILLMRKSRNDRARQQDIAALAHAICAAENAEIPTCSNRLSLLQNLIGTSPAEAVFITIHLHKSLRSPGDVCEFGVAEGATSALLANEIADTDRALWLYDSFAGLPKPTQEDVLLDDVWNLGDIMKYEGMFAHNETKVLKRLQKLPKPFDRHHLVKGMFENGPETKGPDKICFAYIDFDFYKSIREALEFIHDRLSVGGAIIVDDYGFFSAGAQRAVDEFMEARRGAYEFRVVSPNYGHFCILRRKT
jgi:hypothetical protein